MTVRKQAAAKAIQKLPGDPPGEGTNAAGESHKDAAARRASALAQALELANDNKAVEPAGGPRQVSDEEAEAATIAAAQAHAEAELEGQGRPAETGPALKASSKAGLITRGLAATRDPRFEAMANDLNTDFGIGGHHIGDHEHGHDGGIGDD
jgi:hypothetical protein